MLYTYKALDQTGATREGNIEAVSEDVAISSLQRRGLTLVHIEAQDEKKGFGNIVLFERVTNKEIVILSRQIATLFEAQVSVLRIFRLLASEAGNPLLQRKLTAVVDDLQAGASISKALSKHPEVFSDLYVNMVRAGEESGKLDATFLYLADYLDRSYELVSKARNALVYPAFIIATFITVMVLMMTLVIPKLSEILLETGQEIPLYTKIVIGTSLFFVDYGYLLLFLLAAGGVWLWRYSRGERGSFVIDNFKLSVPFLGTVYRKLYLSRIADNFSTMLQSGIPMLRTLEITAAVVGNKVYETILKEVANKVQSGSPVSEAFQQHPEIPGIMTQMVKVGEESGELGAILKTLAKFYQREVEGAVENMVNLIEPVLIVVLAVGVGILLASVLVPIYNIAGGI